MAFWEYTLTGFGDFLEQRSVAFTEQMPASRVCSICGRVPSSTVLLACGHVLCEDCRGEVFEGMVCPFDGRASTEGQLVRLRFELTDLEQTRVVCMVGGRKCATFAGKLSELRDHLRHCRSGDVKCAKCHRSFARDAAVNHYRQGCDVIVPRHSAIHVRVQRAVEEIRGIKEDLESLRQRASGERDSDDDLVNGANGLVERLASLDSVLSEAQEMASGVDREGVPLLSPMKPPTPGPFRAASKPGVFIATCKFTDVMAARARVSQTKEYTVSSEICTLSGYTFRLHCQFFFSGGEGSGEVNVKFMMCLQNGEWDDYLQWPFTKKVTFTITHPRDETNDVKLTARFEGYSVAKKPLPGVSNEGYWTKKKSWKDIEFEGFVIKNALYVNVEFH